MMRKEGTAFVLPNDVSLSSRFKHLCQECEISEITKTLVLYWRLKADIVDCMEVVPVMCS